MAQNARLLLTVTSLTFCLGLVHVTPAARSGQGAPKAKVRLNKIIEQFEQGKPAFANEHWQFISIEHTLLFDDYAKAMASLQPAKGEVRPRLTPVVRIVPSADEPFKSAVKQVLDDGAFGVVLPDVTTKEEVMRFVSAMRYPQQPGSKYPRPEGVRGWGPTGARRMMGGLSDLEHHLKADLWPLNPEGELLAIVMIETREAVRNIYDILRVPGLGGALVGPFDLSLSLGSGNPAPDVRSSAVAQATATVAKACVELKKLCGTFGSPDTNATLGQGFKLIPYARPK